MKKYYVFLIPLFALALLVGCGQQNPPTEQNPPPASETSPPAEPTAENPSPETPPPADVTPPAPAGFDGTLLTGKHTVILHTSLGDVTLELDADSAPQTVTNFVVLGRTGYYNGLTFHRVIKDFMIQGGDPNGNGTGGESIFGPTFDDETTNNPIPLVRGVIAMANRGPNTNGSQFFIITRADGTPWLLGKHTPFGHVTEGLEVVDTISTVSVGANEKPVDPVTFTVEVVN
ncbi:MAG: peptidylprolyl isomerase [Candidatus Peribacteraceae bacterium]|nr:peptidylprolyl isomerase [Candidatus Peribacteraceae bacterium]MDD5741872.1 peptidylprolyl isomerase [Candidatus Peribacteraceae bacterium]